MKTAIQIRDALLAAAGEAFPDVPSGNRVSKKQDKVEEWPFVSVYLEDMTSSKTAMRGGRERDQDVIVMLYRKGKIDLESTFADDEELFENLVEKKRKLGAFGNNTSIFMSSAGMNFPPDSKNKFGALVMRFSCRYPKTVG